MTKQILMFVDMHSDKEDGQVDELDMIRALREIIPALNESNATRGEDERPMISLGFYVGEESEGIHVGALVGDADVLSRLYNQVEAMIKMAQMVENFGEAAMNYPRDAGDLDDDDEDEDEDEENPDDYFNDDDPNDD